MGSCNCAEWLKVDARKTCTGSNRTVHNRAQQLGEGGRNVSVARRQVVFSQGDVADPVFYIRKGKVRLTVVSKPGKEATMAIMSESNFFGRPSALLEGLCSGQF